MSAYSKQVLFFYSGRIRWKTVRFGLWLTSDEKTIVVQLAEIEGGLSQAALIRRLIREAAQKHGIYLPVTHDYSAEPSYVGGHNAPHQN